MRVIVTGGAGFIGSAVCRFLVADIGIEVLNIDKLTYAANPRSLEPILGHPNYHFHQADVCDQASMDTAFADFRPDAVIHLAAETHVDRSITGSDAFVETNIVGSYALLKSATSYWRSRNFVADKFRFLHVSTDEVYGSLGPTGLFSEATPYDPSSPYSASKAAADHLVIAWHRTYGLPVIISNCSNNYGPYQFPEKLIPLMISHCSHGETSPHLRRRQEYSRLALCRRSRTCAPSYFDARASRRKVQRWSAKRKDQSSRSRAHLRSHGHPSSARGTPRAPRHLRGRPTRP